MVAVHDYPTIAEFNSLKDLDRTRVIFPINSKAQMKNLSVSNRLRIKMKVLVLLGFFAIIWTSNAVTFPLFNGTCPDNLEANSSNHNDLWVISL